MTYVNASNPQNPLRAADPHVNAVVKASAGVGKTYLLVTRLLRLLASGAKPDAILAITFTRKAAMEMQTRLGERLLELAQCADDELDNNLVALGETPTPASRARARQLYEAFMHAEVGLRATTFHAFCQDILRRFPLEADVPPGFKLLEYTGAYKQAAWDALYAEATAQPDGEIARALEAVYKQCQSIGSTKTALSSLLEHRGDWWAYTMGQVDPVLFAQQQLLGHLNIDLEKNPYDEFHTPLILDMLKEFATALCVHVTQKNIDHADTLNTAIKHSDSGEELLNSVHTVFLTKEGDVRSRKPSAAQKKSMGEAAETRFLEIHEFIAARILRLQKEMAKYHTYARCAAWYRAGQRFIEHFQKIKLEQRLVDFTDLEWKAYCLLTQSDNALWIQYKLDQRIDHLLVDEFQDTNPTQWRLLLPILQELAAQSDRARSAFIVGDDKQSIYGFRRADARLLDAAGEWMSEYLDAGHYSMDKSRRSSPAIMNFVNRLFMSPPLNEHMPSFQEHSTVHETLPGAVVLLPLVVEEPKQTIDTDTPLRNPLHTPRANDAEENRFMREGRLIADAIKQLKQSFGTGQDRAPLRYGDIMLLLRTRTHLVHFESALRAAHIPYVSGGKTSLLDSRAVKDITALLQILITPYYDLGLATVLRSPIFGCTDDDLIVVANSEGKTWHDKLATVATRDNANPRLAYAYQRTEAWRALAGKRPVHDLLDKIYADNSVIKRYHAAYPAHLRDQVGRQLQELLTLALEVDSGRYPTVGRFLEQLAEIRLHDNDSIGDASPTHVDAVQVMTIHAAKGLEATVVFLADAAEESNPKNAYSSLVAWPADAEKPQHFLLLAKKDDLDEYSSQLLNEKIQRENKENANLLYVAVTRAKQLLFVSGSKTDKKSDDKLGWYGTIQALGEIASDYAPDDNTKPVNAKPAATSSPLPFDISLNTRDAVDETDTVLNPSQTTDSEFRDYQAQQRGQAIHRCLQLLTQGNEEPHVLQQLAFEQKLPVDTPWLTTALKEAKQVITHNAFRPWFDSALYVKAFNELPLYYRIGERVVMGIIDRAVICNDHVTLIDYKTHRQTDDSSIKNIAAEYRQQMLLYWQGAKKLWPDKPIKPILVFTSNCRSHPYLDFETENDTV